MSSLCHPIPRNVAEDMLQVAAHAMCSRPSDTAAQRDSRTRQMIQTVMGCEPRDGLEYMLAVLVFGHFQLILDAMSDVFRGQTAPEKAKTTKSIVALDRALLEAMRELRQMRMRPMAYPIETSRPGEAEATQKWAPAPTAPRPAPASAAPKPKIAVAADAASAKSPPAAADQAPAPQGRDELTDGTDLLAPDVVRRLAALIDPAAARARIDGEGTPEGRAAAVQAIFNDTYARSMEILEECRANDAAVAEASGD